MPCSGTRKCRHCHTFFKPDPRSKGRQTFCSLSDCQQASKKTSQKNGCKNRKIRIIFVGLNMSRESGSGVRKTPDIPKGLKSRRLPLNRYKIPYSRKILKIIRKQRFLSKIRYKISY